MEKIESNRRDIAGRKTSTTIDKPLQSSLSPQSAGIVYPDSTRNLEGGRVANELQIDYKNTTLLFRYLTEQGKIIPRRLSGLTAKQQRHMTKAIKQARILGLIRFTNNK